MRRMILAFAAAMGGGFGGAGRRCMLAPVKEKDA